MKQWCWVCGINFESDRPLETACPECEQKANRRIAERLKEAVPFFRGIAERIGAVLGR